MLVTGASSGIGRAVGLAFARDGASLLLLGRNPARLARVAHEAASLTRGRVAAFAADLGIPADVQRVLDEIRQTTTTVDVVVNAAGHYPSGTLERLERDEVIEQMALHVHATLQIINACIPGMKRRRFGRIVNVASAAAFLGSHAPAYAISKYALVGLTRSIAKAVAAYGVTANVVVPGPIASPMTRGVGQARRQRLLRGIPARRFGAIREVAEPIGFLCSEGAAFITGQCLHVNGGLYLSD